jgi:nitrous oxidase accessory protein
MNRPALKAAILSIAAAATFLGPVARGADRSVAAGGGALQAVIDSAAPGDVITLGAGRHQGPVLIDRSLTLQGTPGAIIEGPDKGSVVTIVADSVTVRGLTIVGSGSSPETLDAGVKLTTAAHGGKVLDNDFEGNLVGVDVHGATGTLVRGNTIIGRQDFRMNDRGNGIYIWNAPDTVIEDNLVRFGRDGIFVNTSNNDTFRGNRFEHLRFAVHYMYTNGGVLTDNVSTGNHAGFVLMYSRDLKVIGNRSSGDAQHGIMMNYVNDADVERNLVENGGEKCLFMYNANKNRIADNRFEGCPIGIHFTAGSERNALTGNAFIGNRIQVKYVGTRWLDWSADGRGNYWSDHTAFDLDGDGLADMPYRPNDVMDQILWRQPSARLLLGSPAVQLIRWTMAKFPALLPGGIIDRHPLMRPVELQAPAAEGGS